MPDGILSEQNLFRSPHGNPNGFHTVHKNERDSFAPSYTSAVSEGGFFSLIIFCPCSGRKERKTVYFFLNIHIFHPFQHMILMNENIFLKIAFPHIVSFPCFPKNRIQGSCYDYIISAGIK